MKNKKEIANPKHNLKQKAKNDKSIRLLYKKVGQVPEVKIIDNVFKLKKAIVRKKLEIIPYETLYIICLNKEKMKGKPINIVLDFRHIAGDFLLVGIDRKTREFQSLSQEDINWFIENLIHKSPIKEQDKKQIYQKELKQDIGKRYFEENNNQYIFENKLIKVLTNIELTLETLLINKKKKYKR